MVATMKPPIIWQPYFATQSILGAALVLAALAVFAWWRVRVTAPRWAALLLIVRLAAIAGLSTLLMGPSREQPTAIGHERARLAILLDTSQSMQVQDCGEESRIAHAAHAVLDPKRLAVWDKDFQVSLDGFDSRLHPMDSGISYDDPERLAQGTETRLNESVTAALRQMRDGANALLVVSDGRDTSDESVQQAASLAATRKIPIYTVAVGGASTVADAALLAIPMQDTLLPNEPGGLLIRIYQAGLDGAKGTVRIRQGASEQRIPVSLGGQSVLELQTAIREEKPGQYEFAVSLEPIDGETELSNNEQKVFVEVTKRRMRVLLIEGQPFWDSKFLAQSLRKDEQIELVQLTQVGNHKREAIVTRDTEHAVRLPASAEEWSSYDVVILGRDVERLLDEAGAAALVRFVENGGNVVFARGRAYDVASPNGEAVKAALRPIEPVIWSDVKEPATRIEMTPSGRTASWLSAGKMAVDVDQAFARLPGLEVLQRVESLKPATIVLANGLNPGGQGDGAEPAIVRMTAGRGSVAAILGEGTWRWSLLTPDLQDLRGFYDQFWSNLVRWMSLGGDFPPGQQTSLQLSRSSTRLGDEMTIDVVYRFAPDGFQPPQVKITDAAGQTVEAAAARLPGPSPRFRTTFTPKQPGVYHVVAQTPSMTPPQLEARFNVYDVNLERLQTAANPIALQMLADLSGGMAVDAADLDKLTDQFERNRRAQQSPPRLEYLWDRGWVMTILLGAFCLEWVLRRFAGLW
jgi:hypothetical protein